MSPRYVDNIADIVLQHCDIISVISRYTPLKKAGRNHKGLCPFHQEKTPSFVVSEEKQVFHCFGCGAGGSVIQFVMMSEKLEFIEAIELLAEQNGLDLSRYVLQKGNDAENRRNSQIREAVRDAAVFFYRNLHRTDGPAMQYLRNRGLDDATIKAFGLGYAPEEWDQLFRFLREKGYAPDLLEKAGLVIARNGQSGCYDRFRNRVIFPIQDNRGKVIGFGGRVLDDSLPKYLNSPESPIFDKSRTLYAFHIARKHMKASEPMILVEGYMDVVSLHQWGFQNTVASLGTAFTEYHARALKRSTDDIVLCYDSDSAGVKATLRALDILSSEGIHPRIINLGSSKDPDDFIRKEGSEEFQKAIDQAVPGVRFTLSQIEKSYDLSNTTGQLKYLHDAAAVISKLKNSVEREDYVNLLSEQTRKSPEAIYGLLRDGENSDLGIATRELGELKPMERADVSLSSIESRVLETAAHGRRVYEVLKKQIQPEWFMSPSAVEIWSAFERYYIEYENFRFDAFVDQLDLDTLSGLSEVLRNAVPVEQETRELRTLVERLQSAYLNNLIVQCEERVKNNQNTLEKNERESIMIRLYELKKELSELKRGKERQDNR